MCSLEVGLSPLDCREQRVDVRGSRVEGAHQAPHVFTRRPVAECKRRSGSRCDLGRQHNKHSVGLDGIRNVKTTHVTTRCDGFEAHGEPSRHVICMTGGAKPKVSLVERGELRRHKPHLGPELQIHLAEERQARCRAWAQHHNCLGAEESVFGATEAEHINTCFGGQRCERAVEVRSGVTQARSIEMKQHAARARVVGALLAKYDIRTAGYSYGYGYHYQHDGYYAYGGKPKLTKS